MDIAYSLGGFTAAVLDPILIIVAIILYGFTSKAATSTQFLIAFVVACIVAFGAGWLDSSVSGAGGTMKIATLVSTWIAFMLVYSIIFGITKLVKIIKS